MSFLSLGIIRVKHTESLGIVIFSAPNYHLSPPRHQCDPQVGLVDEVGGSHGPEATRQLDLGAASDDVCWCPLTVSAHWTGVVGLFGDLQPDVWLICAFCEAVEALKWSPWWKAICSWARRKEHQSLCFYTKSAGR